MHRRSTAGQRGAVASAARSIRRSRKPMLSLLDPTAMRPAFLSGAVAAAAAACAAAVITGGVINAPVAAPASPRELVAVLKHAAAADPAAGRLERRSVT